MIRATSTAFKKVKYCFNSVKVNLLTEGFLWTLAALSLFATFSDKCFYLIQAEKSKLT